MSFLFRYIVIILFSLTGLKKSYAQKRNDKTDITFYRISTPSRLSQIRFTKDTIYRDNIEPSNDSITTLTKYYIYKVFKLKRSRFFLVSPYFGMDKEGFEVISLTKFPEKRYKLATTEQTLIVYTKYPKRKSIKKHYGDTHKLPYISLFTKKEVEKFSQFPSITNVSIKIVENVLDSLIEIKREYILAPEQQRTMERSVLYLYDEFISLALIKNNVNPFYSGSFFQLIQKREDNRVILEKSELFFNPHN
jgi:hypothetical protein